MRRVKSRRPVAASAGVHLTDLQTPYTLSPVLSSHSHYHLPSELATNAGNMPFLLPPSSKKIKNLVLSLDAFGTIFHPRRPIAQQYISAAQAHGLKIDWKDEESVLAEFKGGESR